MGQAEADTREQLQRLLELAKAGFGFLENVGFTLTQEAGPSGSSFKDGWHLRYEGAAVAAAVSYYDMEFTVTFSHGATTATYEFLDRNVFSNSSGFAGNMFPISKLARAISTIARDMRDSYAAVLDGDPRMWDVIRRLVEAPPEKETGLP